MDFFQENFRRFGITMDRAQGLVQFVRERAGQLTKQRNAREVSQLATLPRRFQFSLPALGDVYARAK